MSDINQANNTANQLHQQGIAISIDDFGTGYSSLAYLHKIPASLVKIDRSFTQRIEHDTTMVASIQHLIKSLKLSTIVEGVETRTQSEILKSLGIYLQQGFGLGMPEPLAFYLDENNIKRLAGLM